MDKEKQGAQEKQTAPEKRRRKVRFSRDVILLAVLLVAFAGLGAYGIMSDLSIRGLTVKFYNVSRYCPAGTTVVTFSFATVVVYSSNSLPTSLSHVSFAMSADGVAVGTQSAADSSFNAGQSARYNSLNFSNTALDPHSQPTSSTIDLTIDAQVSAGLFSSQVSASDSELVHFSGPPC